MNTISILSTLTKIKDATYGRLPVGLQDVARSAVRGFLAAELVLVPAVLAAPDVSTQEQLLLAGTIAAGAAAVRAVQVGVEKYFALKA